MKRDPMSTFSWFRDGGLAIADVVWVDGLGLCSHQPVLGKTLDVSIHRMQDEQGGIHFVDRKQMYEASREEADTYWRKRLP